jgi:hypothetical protein
VVEVAGPVVLNEPHAAPLAGQATDHLTPAFVESFASVTVSDAVAFTWSEDGRVEEKEMEIGPGGVLIGEDPPPQAASAALVQMASNSEIDRWIDIMAPGIISPSRSDASD